uniref:Uncharacterized protein n=1 Tax=Anopheles atroparvus TaxID=41427 RepID=A0A182IRC3_ANOAO
MYSLRRMSTIKSGIHSRHSCRMRSSVMTTLRSGSRASRISFTRNSSYSIGVRRHMSQKSVVFAGATGFAELLERVLDRDERAANELRVVFALDRPVVGGQLADRFLLQLLDGTEPPDEGRDEVRLEIELRVVLEEANQQLAHRVHVPRFVLDLHRVAQVPRAIVDASDPLLQVLHRGDDGQFARLEVEDQHHHEAVGVHLLVHREDVRAVRPELHRQRQLVDARVELHQRVDELAVVATAGVAEVDVALKIRPHVHRPQQRHLGAEDFRHARKRTVPVHPSAHDVDQLDLLLAFVALLREVDVKVQIAILQQQTRLDRAELVYRGLIAGKQKHTPQVVLHHVEGHLDVTRGRLQRTDEGLHLLSRGTRTQVAGLDRVDAHLFEGFGEPLQLGVVVQLGPVQQSARPGEDRRDRVGGRFLALLVLTVVPRDGTVGGFRLHRATVRAYQHRRHQSERAESLRHRVRLHVTVVVLAGPHEATLGLHAVGDHIVDQPVLVPDAGRIELLLVVLFVDLLEEVLEATVVLLQDRVLGAEVERELSIQCDLERRVGKVPDRVVQVVHAHRDAGTLVLVHQPGTSRGMFLQMIASRNTVPPRMLRIVPFGERHICFSLNSSTRASSGVMVAHLMPTLKRFTASAQSTVTLSSVASRFSMPRSYVCSSMSRNGRISLSLIESQMMRVISSPRMSTTGPALIFAAIV